MMGCSVHVLERQNSTRILFYLKVNQWVIK